MAARHDGPEELLHHERHPRDRLGRPLKQGSPNELPLPVEPAELTTSLDQALGFAAVLWDAQRFFEAHEFFEHLWKAKKTAASDRELWQGVTQIAAAFCHVQRGNPPGAFTLFHRGLDNLHGYPRRHLGVDTARLRRQARRAVEEIRRGSEVHLPAFPFASDSTRLEAAVFGTIAAIGVADAIWLAADPRGWSRFWRRGMRAIGREPVLLWASAISEIALAGWLLVKQLRPPRRPASIPFSTFDASVAPALSPPRR